MCQIYKNLVYLCFVRFILKLYKFHLFTSTFDHAHLGSVVVKNKRTGLSVGSIDLLADVVPRCSLFLSCQHPGSWIPCFLPESKPIRAYFSLLLLATGTSYITSLRQHPDSCFLCFLAGSKPCTRILCCQRSWSLESGEGGLSRQCDIVDEWFQGAAVKTSDLRFSKRGVLYAKNILAATSRSSVLLALCELNKENMVIIFNINRTKEKSMKILYRFLKSQCFLK